MVKGYLFLEVDLEERELDDSMVHRSVLINLGITLGLWIDCPTFFFFLGFCFFGFCFFGLSFTYLTSYFS